MNRFVTRVLPCLAALLCTFATSAPGVAAPARARVPGIDRAFLDTTCAPCRDFFQYTNGAWLESMTIPAAYSSWGAGEELEDFNREALHQLLEQAAREVDRAPDENARKLGLFYGTCMDSEGAEALGMQPLRPLLGDIDGMKTRDDLAAVLERLHESGSGGLMGFGVGQDPKNSSRYLINMGQGGLGLPDRDYYLKSDSESVALRGEYLGHVERTLRLIGESETTSRDEASRILVIETALARASMTRVQRRDPQATYHLMKFADVQAASPSFRWADYLRASGLPESPEFNVLQPVFLHAMDSLLSAVPLEDWKAYLRWHLADAGSPYLSKAFVDESFRFEKLLTGAKEQRPRWKRCLASTDNDLGEALGKYYTDRYFTPEAKVRMQDMVDHLRAALRGRLESLPWMNDTTRAEALAKLAAFGRKLGYPDHWRDYSALKVERGPFFSNWSAAQKFETHRVHARLGQPVDRSEWHMTAPTVNAYYSSSLNEIVFPAGILQPPYFDVSYEDAVNYGVTGSTIGHEMTHGFDDHGRQFDSKGNLRDWWTPEDARQYKLRADRVAEQYDGYLAVDTLHVNGHLTLGENIADLGGLAIAYEAWRKLHEAEVAENKVGRDGFTPDQRFFVAYGQGWREATRDERQRTLVATDPHSPERWRVNGPLSNLPEFARAFHCKAGDAMVRPDSVRVRIW